MATTKWAVLGSSWVELSQHLALTHSGASLDQARATARPLLEWVACIQQFSPSPHAGRARAPLLRSRLARFSSWPWSPLWLAARRPALRPTPLRPTRASIRARGTRAPTAAASAESRSRARLAPQEAGAVAAHAPESHELQASSAQRSCNWISTASKGAIRATSSSAHVASSSHWPSCSLLAVKRRASTSTIHIQSTPARA